MGKKYVFSTADMNGMEGKKFYLCNDVDGIVKCNHNQDDISEIGITNWEGATAYIMWCRNCGAIRREQRSARYKVQKWKLPKGYCNGHR